MSIRTVHRRDPRSGFTMVEMLVVSILGSLLLMATYQILITNQRTYAVQAGKVQGMQTTRAGLEILTSELREINTSDGDLIGMEDSRIQVRSMRRFGIGCAATYGATPTVTVRKYDAFFSSGDSVMVFAENDGSTTGDDVWIPASVTSIDTTATCNGEPAQILTFGSQQALFDPSSGGDSVSSGAPVRSFQRYGYRQDTIDGQIVLARRSASGTVPLVGPLDADGLTFTYLDANGNVTNVPTDVAQIVVDLKTTADVTTAQGNRVWDSVTVRIYPRN